jgi:hypothetical protein
MPKQVGYEKDERISRRLFDRLIDEHCRSIKNLVGRLLTIVDGVTDNDVQRKAIKDLIEDVVYRHSSLKDENIRYYMRHLARALKEDCDWVDQIAPNKDCNPLTD